jgi:hypothetical protein
MASLSPTAQAVMIAATNGNFNVVNDPVYRQCIAAALRATANQVAPDDYASFTGHIEWDQGMETRSDSIREAIFAIADELDGTNTIN